MTADAAMIQRQRVAELVQNWAIWRDAGDWERFRTCWHEDGFMMATWCQAPAADFIAASQAGWAKGVSILHFLGGISVDVEGRRAIAQTKMTISQRAAVDGVAVDVVCTGHDHEERAEVIERPTGRFVLSAANTLSNRMRGRRPSALNVIEATATSITVTPWSYDAERASFRPGPTTVTAPRRSAGVPVPP